MTWIKICANTNLEDARAAVEAGADAVGFVFARSPRRVDAATVREIVQQLPDSVEKVGVFENEPVDHICDVVRQTGLTAVQLHGGEPLAFARMLHEKLSALITPKIIRGGRLAEFTGGPNQENTAWDPVAAGIVEMDKDNSVRPGVISAILVDSGSAAQRGGTGKTFDWGRAQFAFTMMNTSAKVIVAGGLTPQNVNEAISVLRPWGVDVCSGVESSPGKKDHARVREFVAAVRNRRERL